MFRTFGRLVQSFAASRVVQLKIQDVHNFRQ